MKLPTIKAFVENLYNKNQFVITITLNGVKWYIFQSYTSECAMYNTSKGELYLNTKCWLSKTTSKHLYLFINDYTRLSVHSKKELEELISDKDIKLYAR